MLSPNILKIRNDFLEKKVCGKFPHTGPKYNCGCLYWYDNSQEVIIFFSHFLNRFLRKIFFMMTR